MLTPKTINLVLCGAACVLALNACSTAKKQLGLTHKAPDEFAVVKRAPLEMPPQYSALPVPQPGAPRPQEMATDEQARQAMFGEDKPVEAAVTPTTAENILLQQAGGGESLPGIRAIVNQETDNLAPREKPVAERLLGWASKDSEPAARVVDAKAEAERLKQNTADGKPVTDGATPTVEE